MAGSGGNRDLNALVSSLQAEAPIQDPLGTRRSIENGPLGEDFPRGKRRRYTTNYTDEDRAAIAKYAYEHGNAAAIKQFMPQFNLPESTVRSFKKRYLEELANIRKSGVEVGELTMVPARKKGRKSRAVLEAIKYVSSAAGLDDSSFADQSLEGGLSANDSMDTPIASTAIPTRSRRLQLVKPPIQVPMLIPTAIQEPPSPSHSHSSDDSSSSSPPVKRVRKSEPSKTTDLLTKILSEVTHNREKDNSDEDALFGLQVAANLRRLTSKQKATAKIRIQQVLLEIEFPTET